MKRFEWNGWHSEMKQHEDGEYVAYETAQKLAKACQLYQECARAARDGNWSEKRQLAFMEANQLYKEAIEG